MLKKLLNYFAIILIEVLVLLTAVFISGVDKYLGLSVPCLVIIVLIISVILLLYVKWLMYRFGERRYLKSPIGKIDQMSGEEFEEYLCHKFKKRGYKVEMTPASGDYGADLVCRNKEGVLIVQAKRYEGHVGTAAVQEVAAARDFYEADRCMVVTNNYFTKNAIELADANNVELIDRDELMSL